MHLSIVYWSHEAPVSWVHSAHSEHSYCGVHVLTHNTTVFKLNGGHANVTPPRWDSLALCPHQRALSESSVQSSVQMMCNIKFTLTWPHPPSTTHTPLEITQSPWHTPVRTLLPFLEPPR